MKKFFNNIAVIMLTLATGFTKTCGPRSGGVVRLWLCDRDNVTSFTLNTSTKEYSAVTMVGASVFYKFEFDQDSAMFKEDGTRENKSSKITKTIEFFLGKITQTTRNRIQDIMDSSNCGIIAIVEDTNAQKWVMGYTENFTKERPMELKSGVADSGKAFTDANGTTVVLESTDNEYSHVFTGTVPV